MSLQIMDFLLCLFTLLGSYVELPTYLKFASRSRAVSTQPHAHAAQPGEVGGVLAVSGSPQGPFGVGGLQQVPEPSKSP